MSATTIGFLGTGAMGSRMVARLTEHGRQVVVHNRTRDHAADALAAGARWAEDPAEVAATADVVISCLRDTRAVTAVLGDLLPDARPGQVFVEHGTFAPETARELAAVAARRDAAFLDVPVTGGPEGARTGQLSGMAGGDKDAFASVHEILGSYCARLMHIGPAGAGLELKLVNQLLVSVHVAAAGEAIALLCSLEQDLDAAHRVLLGGWASSAMLDRSLRNVIDGTLADTGATIEGMDEVQALVDRLLDAHAQDAPVFAASRNLFRHAVEAGRGSADLATLGLLDLPHATRTPRKAP
jgi:3-hydroxyisobutyrate dehydrogenase-like beta-hydroxyacid dehydrogenase